MSENNSEAAAFKPEDLQNAQLNVLGQYIKDLSFESPNSPASLENPGQNPNLQIGVNVAAQKYGADMYEVAIDLEAKANNDDGVIYNLELVYGGIFRLQHIPPQAIQPVLLVDCPGLLFPFVRRIAVDMTREGGFPPLLLDPIDFSALYKNNMDTGNIERAKETAQH